jgi:hypothetical protein
VHRIGRTGRAGATGTAISLVSPEEEKYLADIEKLIKTEIRKERAELPARRPHAQRGDRPEHGHKYHTPSPAKPNHDPWFDKPYVPSISAPAAPVKKPDEPVLAKPKAQIPALFRKPG